MADASDWQQQQAESIMEVWDPTVNNGRGGNVYTGGQNASYIANNPSHYQNYTGAVTHLQNTPISANAYVPGTTPYQSQTGPTGFNPQAYEEAQQREVLRGGGQYNPYSEAYNQQEKGWGQAVRMIPGVRPDVGTLAGTGEFYDLAHKKRINQQDYGKYGIDPLTQAYGRVAASQPISPSYTDAIQQGLRVSGRGYHYGQETPEMQALGQRFLQGDMAAGQELARLRQAGIQGNQLTGLKKFGSKYYAPALMAAITAVTGGTMAPVIGGFGGLAAAAAAGAFGSGTMSKWKNPAAIGAGAVGGLAGGWGGQALGQGLGAGAIGTGALRGAGSSLGSSVGRGLVTNDWNASQILRDAAVSGVGGGVGGYLGSQVDPRLNPFAHEAVPFLGQRAVNIAANQFIPNPAQEEFENRRRIEAQKRAEALRRTSRGDK